MSLLELVELLAVVAFIALAVAAGVAALVRKERPLRLLWIAGFFLLASMAIATGEDSMLMAILEFFRR